MREITGLTNDSKQRYEMVLDDNSIVELVLEYVDTNSSWLFSVSRNDFAVNQRNLVVGPNVLRQFKNYIPFGLLVESADLLDPAFIDDFEKNRISLYILDEGDVTFVEDEYFVR